MTIYLICKDNNEVYYVDYKISDVDDDYIIDPHTIAMLAID
jgi:hypothetical protein